MYYNIYMFLSFAEKIKEDRESSLTELLADNESMLEDELEPFRFLQSFQKDGLFSQVEVEAIKRQESRRSRVREFLHRLKNKENGAKAFIDELEKLNETYIKKQLFPSLESVQSKGTFVGFSLLE